MKHAYIIALVLSFAPSFLSAQPVFRGSSTAPSDPEAFTRQFSEYHLFQIDAPTLNRYVKSTPGSLPLELQLGDTYHWQLSLQAQDIRPEHYRLVALTPRGEEVQPHTANKTFQGKTLGAQGGEARLTLDEHFIYGFVETGNETYYIEPAWYYDPGLEEDIYLAYPASAVANAGAFTCGWDGEVTPQTRELPAPQAERFVLACFQAEVALAADFSMVQQFGSVNGVENFMLGVLNNVQSNYDDEFNHQIFFVVAAMYVSSCSTCDPWTSSRNSGFLLDNFTDWGNNGGFGVNYDLASLWSNRDFLGDAIGVAWVGSTCTDARFNVLQNFSTNGALLRVLQAHEFGHNFNAGHDSPGSNFIMAPSVNNSNSWSNASRSAINSFVNALISVPGCLTTCGTVIDPPVAALAANPTSGCNPLVVHFSDLSTGQVDNLSWQFPGGTPATSSNSFPTVTYNTPGVYDVILTVSNIGGDNTVVIPDLIVVEPQPIAQFSVMVDGLTVYFDNTSSNAQDFQWSFGDGSISNQSSPSHTYLVDGLYLATLTANSACGPVTAEQYIVVEMPMQAAFASNTQQGCPGTRVSFTDQTSGLPVSWNWTFEGGNPSTSTSPNPIVDYETPGLYAVTLVTTNALGTTSNAVQQGYVEIFPEPVASYSMQASPGNLTVQFTNTSTGADSWYWDFGDGTNSNLKNPTHTYAANGTYTATLTAYGPCGDDALSQNINIFTPPSAAFSASVLSGCAPLMVQFDNGSSPNATDFQWQFQGGNPATSTLPGPVVTFNAPGTYMVTLIAGNPAGSDTTTQSVVIEGGPQSNFAIDYTLGETLAHFENQSGNADTILWAFPGGTTSTENSPSFDFGADGVYSVTLIAANACGRDSLTQQIEVITPPAAALGLANDTGCAPFAVQPDNLSSSNTTSWEWAAPGAMPAASFDPNPSFTYPAPGAYTIILTAANAAGMSSDTLSVNVGDVPLSAFTTTTTLGQTILGLANNSQNAVSYDWDFGDGNSSSETEPAHTYAQDGTYTVQLIATNTCGSDTSSQEVSVITAPTAAFELDAASGCAPFTVQVNDLSSNNTTGWNWSAPGATPETSGAQNPSFTFAAPGAYTITLEASNAAGTSMQSISVSVGDIPEASFAASIAPGQTTLSLTNNSQDAVSYAWDFGDGNSSTETEPAHTYAQDGTYTVQLIATNACGSDTSSQEVSVVTAPTAAFELDAASGCAPFAVQVNDLSSNNTTGWNWSAPGAMPEISNAQNPSFTFAAPGAYIISLEASNAAGSSLESVEIFVNTAPDPGFGFQVNGLEAQFTNTSTNSLGFEWDFGDGNTSTETSPSHHFDAPGEYVATLTAVNECGEASTSNTVTIDLAAPVALFTPSGNEGCAPLTVTFENSSENAESYSWSFPGGIPAAASEPNPTVNYPAPGVYSVTLVALNAAGSGALTRQNIIVVGGPPQSGFEYTSNEATAHFTNTTENADSYVWLFGDGNSSTSEEPEHTYSLGGNYTVTLLATNECGTDTSEQVITLTGSAPMPNLSATVESGCAPLSISFDDGAEGTVTAWQWAFPGGTPDSSTEPDPTVVYEQPGVYDVRLTVSNAFGENSQEETGLVTVIGVPAAAFDFDMQELSLSLNNTSTGVGLSYNWDFGDGNGSGEPNPQHTYAESGEYTVVLTVSNACGESVAEATVAAVVSGIADESWLSELSLFPNPNNGSFTVRLQGQPADHLNLNLLNVVGQPVFHLEDSFHTGYSQRNLDLKQLPAGVYILEVLAGERRAYRRVVVE
ncbi:MAG: PKD domain-containing protein [Lewinellaceae bacterium]|nr:PKD domain-containing protein [Lewinellaceae bacterium]